MCVLEFLSRCLLSCTIWTQTLHRGVLSWATVSCKRIGLLSLRTRSQGSVPQNNFALYFFMFFVCLFFATRLCVMTHYHKLEYMQKFLGCSLQVQGQSHSGGSDPQQQQRAVCSRLKQYHLNCSTTWNHTFYCCVFPWSGVSCRIIWLLPSRSRSQWRFQLKKQKQLKRLFAPYLVNYWTFCQQTFCDGMLLWSRVVQVACTKFGFLSSRSRLQWGLSPQKNDCFVFSELLHFLQAKFGVDMGCHNPQCCAKGSETLFSINVKARVQILCVCPSYTFWTTQHLLVILASRCVITSPVPPGLSVVACLKHLSWLTTMMCWTVGQDALHSLIFHAVVLFLTFCFVPCLHSYVVHILHFVSIAPPPPPPTPTKKGVYLLYGLSEQQQDWSASIPSPTVSVMKSLELIRYFVVISVTLDVRWWMGTQTCQLLYALRAKYKSLTGKKTTFLMWRNKGLCKFPAKMPSSQQWTNGIVARVKLKRKSKLSDMFVKIALKWYALLSQLLSCCYQRAKMVCNIYSQYN